MSSRNAISKMQSKIENKKENKDQINIHKDIITDLFTTIYNEGLWDKLSDESKKYGQVLYTNITGENFVPKYKEMNFSLVQHYNIIKDLLSVPTSQTGFWKVVVKITWIMMLLENDPNIINLLDNEDYQNQIKRTLGEI